MNDLLKDVEDESSRRLFVYNGGFLTQPRVRRILDLAGWEIKLGQPGDDDWVGVWGKSPTSPRGETVARHTQSPILRVEDSFFRSVHPGRSGDPPIGLNLDTKGVHFDSARPSDLEILLATHPLDDTALLNRARDCIDLLKSAHLSKYNAFDPGADLPAAPYVLVIDQTKGDASIEHGGANAGTFHEMLVFAQTEHPGSKIVIKAHPESLTGGRQGHFGPPDEDGRVRFLTDAVSPWALMEGATAVYTVSSQLGFEAIFAGHKPRVFGQPFYGGWGLSIDENPVARRERNLTKAQLFAAAMILYPKWYDPYRDRLCELEDAITGLQAQARSWREDNRGYVATGMRAWKRKPLQQFFGATKPILFAKSLPAARSLAKASDRRVMVWSSAHASNEIGVGASPLPPSDILRIEDGFIRSAGLGANLIAPLSLVRDDIGIYYDPTRESRVERLIAASIDLPQAAHLRAERLIRQIVRGGVSKYNLDAAPLPQWRAGRCIVVPGQVEDDASVVLGCSDVNTNLGLLQVVRAKNPDAVIVYKPHPDVQAGLRPGRLNDAQIQGFADVVLGDADPSALIATADEVWTMTSLFGFEALLRAKPVTCLRAPFYAGWGLTHDLGKIPVRRQAKPTLSGLVHATLIDYPRYIDPVTQLPCPVEVVVERLANGQVPRAGKSNRLLARLQGFVAGYAHLWR